MGQLDGLRAFAVAGVMTLHYNVAPTIGRYIPLGAGTRLRRALGH